MHKYPIFALFQLILLVLLLDGVFQTSHGSENQAGEGGHILKGLNISRKNCKFWVSKFLNGKNVIKNIRDLEESRWAWIIYAQEQKL